MWFRRKIKNRRSGRAHSVLDVKLRSSQVRSARIRLATIAVGISLGSVFALYLLFRTVNWMWDRLVYENKSFAIQQTEVFTDGIISPDQLRRWSGVKVGENLLALDLARVKRDLEFVSMVQSASVERILPGTLRIRVTERVPVAQVNVPRQRPGGGLELAVFQVDAEGCVILPLDARQRAIPLDQSNDQLPLLSGINVSELQPGRVVDSAQVRAALQLIAAFENSPLNNLVDLRRIDISAPGVLVATTGQGSEITLSPGHFDQQLNRWMRIHEECLRSNKIIGTLDLAVMDNTPLRFVEAAVVPPAAPKNVKPPRTRKKNV